ncbi:hypothetical protein HYH03_014957 [Edaphochlamys debaryana]|uniref:phytol kinase n=1 Tax=Edaphochlamys debaryana TaxID=47281 RepID=A0A835XKE2_9CHLO|nr:hypothetical protein HYH03_014957 [Edaphochlamys debaryana]|eukprot:KAG2486377.1 hypothetical protein HYH03_014957 [Edaphochlamys debaryana]
MAASVLEDEAILVGILQLVAFAVRLPLPYGSAQSPRLPLLWEVGASACTMLSSLLYKQVSAPAAVAGQQRLIRGLLETQTLHAAARKLAEAAEAVQGSAGAPSNDLRVAAVQAVVLGCSAVRVTAAAAQRLGDSVVRNNTVTALADSRLMEHAARCLLLFQRPAPFDAVSDGVRRVYLIAYCACLDLKAPRLIAGPCARHAVFVLGLAVLRELEGGAVGRGGGGSGSGGGGGGGGGGGAPCACLGESLLLEGRGAYLQELVRTLGPVLPSQPPSPDLPRPLTATRLLLRVGFAVAASAAQQGAAAGGAGGSRDPPPGAQPPILEGIDSAELITQTFGLLARHRAPTWPWRGPWLVVLSDTWSLAAALLRREVLDIGATDEEQLESLGQSVLRLAGGLLARAPTADGQGPFRFPAEAPPHVAAALAGGALPFLERLLRRAGEEPEGLEAGIVAHTLENSGYWEGLVPLLAYGEPLQAASLVATVTKLLRRTQAEALLEEYEKDADRAVLTAVRRILSELVDPIARPWRSGDPSPAALSRLALVLSLALPEWLPELSRLVRQAAALHEEACAKAQRQGAHPASTAYEPCSMYSFLVYLLGTCTAFAAAGLTPASDVVGEGSAAAGGCSGSAAAGSSSGGLVWPPPGLAEAELVGVTLALMEVWEPLPDEWPGLYRETKCAALRLLESRPEEVAALSASGSAFAWQPEAVRAVAEELQEDADFEGDAEAYEEVAAALEAWAAGEDAVLRSEAAWDASVDKSRLIYLTAQQLVPPAEARRRLGLPACSNPACANLAGDSEAGLRLQQCGRCGRASYCCRECQTAHWRSGHKEACGTCGAGGEGSAGRAC